MQLIKSLVISALLAFPTGVALGGFYGWWGVLLCLPTGFAIGTGVVYWIDYFHNNDRLHCRLLPEHIEDIGLGHKSPVVGYKGQFGDERGETKDETPSN